MSANCIGEMADLWSVPFIYDKRVFTTFLITIHWRMKSVQIKNAILIPVNENFTQLFLENIWLEDLHY